VTETEVTSAFTDKVYIQMQLHLVERRVEVLLGLELAKRENTFEPLFSLGAGCVTKEVYEKIAELYPRNADRALQAEVHKAYKEMQKCFRNIFGPAYLNHDSLKRSGVNNDSDALNAVIAIAAKKHQDTLYQKALSKHKKKWIGLSDAEIEVKKQDLKAPYEAKVAEAALKTYFEPYMLAFVLLSCPGLCYASLVARPSTSENKKDSRDAMKSLKHSEMKIKVKNERDEKNDALKQSILQAKEAENKIKQLVAETQKKSVQNESIDKGITACKAILASLPPTHPRFESASQEYFELLEAQIQIAKKAIKTSEAVQSESFITPNSYAGANVHTYVGTPSITSFPMGNPAADSLGEFGDDDNKTLLTESDEEMEEEEEDAEEEDDDAKSSSTYNYRRVARSNTTTTTTVLQHKQPSLPAIAPSSTGSLLLDNDNDSYEDDVAAFDNFDKASTNKKGRKSNKSMTVSEHSNRSTINNNVEVSQRALTKRKASAGVAAVTNTLKMPRRTRNVGH